MQSTTIGKNILKEMMQSTIIMDKGSQVFVTKNVATAIVAK